MNHLFLAQHLFGLLITLEKIFHILNITALRNYVIGRIPKTFYNRIWYFQKSNVSCSFMNRISLEYKQNERQYITKVT